MSVDADLELANLPPWWVTLEGKKYRARPVSWPAYRRFELGMAEANQVGGTTGAAIVDRTTEDVLYAAFPPRWQDSLRFRPSVVTRIMNLTPIVRKKVLEDFFGYLASSQGLTAPETKTRSSEPSETFAPALNGA